MPRYEVVLVETIEWTVQVHAPDEDEAGEEAAYMWAEDSDRVGFTDAPCGVEVSTVTPVKTPAVSPLAAAAAEFAAMQDLRSLYHYFVAVQAAENAMEISTEELLDHLAGITRSLREMAAT